MSHTEEVIIGSEQGTTFPTKIGTIMCNALIDTGATRSCMSEKYYQKLPLVKIHLLQNINVKLATGSNLAPVGLVTCTFELGKTKFNSDFIVCKNLTDLLYWEGISLYKITSLYDILRMESVYWTTKNMN